MAPKAQKPPAFQFYPKDWDTDENVIPMTYEEEGVYWALCRRYWLAGNTLPADLDSLRSLLKGRPALKKMETLWKAIGRCFVETDGKLAHKKLDAIREEQRANTQKRQAAANERWSRKPAHTTGVQSIQLADAMQCSASSSASSSAEREDARGELPPERPRSIIQRRDLSAFLQGPVFSIPQKWADRVVQGSNGNLTEKDLFTFGQALFDKVERDRIDVTAQGNLLGWLDAELKIWTGRRAARTAGPSAVRPDSLRVIDEMEARRNAS